METTRQERNMQPTHRLDLKTLGFPTPGGRKKEHGKQSGELFRERHLANAVNSGGVVEINLDGSTGGTSSFYDESIGWLIRKNKLGRDEARTRIRIVTSERGLEYIQRLVLLVIDDA